MSRYFRTDQSGRTERHELPSLPLPWQKKSPAPLTASKLHHANKNPVWTSTATIWGVSYPWETTCHWLVLLTFCLTCLFSSFTFFISLICCCQSFWVYVCACASNCVCTCFVLGPINTEHSFLSARRLRRNNNRMLSKEKSFSLFSLQKRSPLLPARLSRGPTVSSGFERWEKYHADISHPHLASLKGVLSTTLLLLSSPGLQQGKQVLPCLNNTEIQ